MGSSKGQIGNKIGALQIRTMGWSYWTEPGHITKWYYASDDWNAPLAENDFFLQTWQ